MKYLVLVGDANGEGDLFTFDNEQQAARCYNTRPTAKLFVLLAEHNKPLTPSAGHFQKGY